ncbi:acyl-CoA dehydrogenase family protein [Variovorax ginsengisoli]|uniref:Alkylation response protein AidB-like acyl-CoA dehydrogenase n=1 Tax=Variovorax ginsengisoli TaxID=363844 RepID=A0ABT9S319_9BURK|nr:acyl-CoA dehydrogenase family protein [Variovorax ginsengisoli]MDP9898748.1 alkylation response protein AidB-like acyl-CoA dehydrogenase [Variovorax ginsengisoli]
MSVLVARAAALLPDIARDAGAREQARELPYALVRRIAEAGLLTFRIPKRYGGPGGSVQDAIRFVIDLSAADSNIAQALRPNYGTIESLLFSGSEQERQLWFPRLLAGDIFGNAGIERGGPHGSIGARLRREGDDFRVTGTKYYSTGALYADWIASIALNDEGKETSFIVPREREGVELVDDFDAIGQRLTASGTTRFHDARIASEEIRPRYIPRDRRNPVTPLFQLYLAAVEAGIARNALHDAVHFAQHHARPIRHSSADRSVDDPYVQETVGQIASQAYAAEAVVLKAAGALDAAWEDQLGDGALNEASIAVAQAQYVAVEAALRASELAFDVGGASATDRRHHIDRHWRNARTVANHNPRQWKAAASGAWHLKGEPPPTTGSF